MRVADLLQVGGVEQLAARAEHGATPLHLAGSGNAVEEVCRFLIQAGGPEQLMCLDDDGATAAAVARRCNTNPVRPLSARTSRCLHALTTVA